MWAGRGGALRVVPQNEGDARMLRLPPNGSRAQDAPVVEGREREMTEASIDRKFTWFAALIAACRARLFRSKRKTTISNATPHHCWRRLRKPNGFDQIRWLRRAKIECAYRTRIIRNPLKRLGFSQGLVCFGTAREPLSLSRNMAVQRDDTVVLVPLELTEYDLYIKPQIRTRRTIHGMQCLYYLGALTVGL